MISELLLFKSSPIARSSLSFRCKDPSFFLFFGTRCKCFSGVACHNRSLSGNVPTEIKVNSDKATFEWVQLKNLRSAIVYVQYFV